MPGCVKMLGAAAAELRDTVRAMPAAAANSDGTIDMMVIGDRVRAGHAGRLSRVGASWFYERCAQHCVHACCSPLGAIVRWQRMDTRWVVRDAFQDRD